MGRDVEARRIYIIGQRSLGIVLPKRFLEALGLGKGDLVVLKLDREKQQIILKPLRE